MKEICIINYASDAAVYGIGTYIKEYVRCLLNLGLKATLIELGTNNRKREFYIYEQNGVRIIHIPSLRTKDVTLYNKCIVRLLRLYLKDSPNLVFHFHYLQSDSLQKCLKKYFPLSKSILTIHYLCWSSKFNGNLTAYENVLKRKNYKYIRAKYQGILESYRREKEFAQAVDQIICLSEDTYELLRRWYDVDSASIIPNGLAPSENFVSAEKHNAIRKLHHIAKDEKIILFVGRIDPIKGIQPLSVAFRKVVEVYPSCRLVIVGDGKIADMQKNTADIITKITFTGRIDKEKLCQWYLMADVAVFPSYYEECSYVGIEMMMHGLPIVASDGYAVKNMFGNYNALITPIGEQSKPAAFAEKLASAILALLQSEELLAEKAYQALQSFKKTYHLRHMQQKYASLLATL